jgi:hypothetical protein
MRSRHYAYTPEAAGAATIAALQTLAGAGSLTLDGTYGTNGFTSELAWKLTLTSANNLSARTFTISYLDAQGNAQTATTAGPNATTLSTTIYAQKVTAITVDGAATAVSVGHANVGYGPWKHLPSRVGYTPSSAMLSYAGTATLAMEATQANIGDNSVFTGTFDYYTKTVNVLPAVSTANTVIYDYDRREMGTRLRVDAWTSGQIRLDLSVPAAG